MWHEQLDVFRGIQLHVIDSWPINMNDIVCFIRMQWNGTISFIDENIVAVFQSFDQHVVIIVEF